MMIDAVKPKDLIPGLPAEIAAECLLRVPYQYHPNLKSVCRGWKALLESPSFHNERRVSGRAEQCICMVRALIPQGSHKPRCTPEYALTVYNTLQNSWHRLTDIGQFPEGIPLFCQCVSVNEKLVVMGGWDPVRLQAVSRVSIYDFCCRKWRRGADMSTVRAFFACAVDGGRVFVAGGHDDRKNALKSAEVYSVEEDKRHTLPDMCRQRDESQGAFVGGKFLVISGYATDAQGHFHSSAEVYDAEADRWSELEGMWRFGGSPSSCISAFGKLLCFRGQEVMEYSAAQNSWNAVWEVAESITNLSPRATVLNDGKIFVSGCGGGEEEIAVLVEGAVAFAGKGRRRGGACIAVKRPPTLSGFVYGACSVQV